MSNSPKKIDPIRETTPEVCRQVKSMIRSARFAALATLDPETGGPIATRVALATASDGAPLVLVSALTPHTGAMLADPRVALLVGEPGKGDPLAYPRISIACNAVRLAPGDEGRAVAESRFLSRHPKARLYAGFADFSYFRLEPTSASLNGGFGKAYALSAGELLVGTNEGLEAMEQSAIEHMNADHSDAVNIIARAFGGAPTDSSWRLTGIDAEGMDLIGGDTGLRVLFPEPLTDAGELRALLVRMTAEGRARLGAGI